MIDQWWTKDVPRVMSETALFYSRMVEKYPEKTVLAVTKEKIIKERNWGSTLNLYESNFDAVLSQLGFVYIPNRIIPGPAFFFPIRDVDGAYPCAQTKPMEGSTLYGMSKYRFIGEKPKGPRWLGNDPLTLKRIMATGTVMIQEGGFDILASRLLCPHAPILSPLTKFLGKNHLAYLRMIGVKRLILMYDNEEAKGSKSDGAGNMSMEQQIASIKSLKIIPEVQERICPLSDPSTCLESPRAAKQLKELLFREFKY